MSSQGLSINRLINVTVNLAPIAAQGANFNNALIIGDSDVINTLVRIKSYNSIEGVAQDFNVGDPEYKSAVEYFSQVPQPNQGYIGRWASTDTSGQLYCGFLSAAEQDIASWNAIVAGNLKLSVDGGGLTNIVCGSFAAAGNLNAVAGIIQTAVRAVAGDYAAVDVIWSGKQFIITSGTAGDGSAVAALGIGTANDISAKMKGTAGTLSQIVPGIDAETPEEAVIILDQNATSWYGLTWATTQVITNQQFLDVAGYIEAAAKPHIQGITSTDAECTDPTSTTDIAYETENAAYNRTFVQYSDNAYAASSFFGRAVTVNFAGSNTMLTMMYKVEPGVVPQNLDATQADALKEKNANVFVQYDNDTAIIQYGTVASGAFFDEIFGLDWLKNAIQVAVFNLLYQTPTKIPQTDAGNHQIVNVITQVLDQSVNNGLVAPGQWNAPGFGQLAQGDFLSKGYYVFCPPINSQAQVDREARRSVPIQIAVKLAGAIHTVDILINVNR